MDIFEAARQGNSQVVRRCLAKGADINARDDGEYTAVMCAVDARHFDLADDLRRDGASFTPADATKILVELCGDDAGPVARYVLAAGADPHALDSFNREVLISAAWLGSAEMVRELLDAGAHVNAVDGQGVTALIAAAAKPDRAAVKMLLDAGADPAATTTNRQTAVHAALQTGHAPILRRLLEAGAPANPMDGGWPPLLLAARKGRLSLVKPLLEAKADPNATAPDYDALDGRLVKGATALMLAAEAGNLPSVDLLLAAGADPTLRDDRGQTALSRAAALGQSPVIERLQAVCPTLEFNRAAFATAALLRAAETGDASSIGRLLVLGADLTARSKACETLGQTAVHLAATGGHAPVLEALLASGADPNQIDSNGETPLHSAAREGRVEAVAALLAAGANRSAVDESGTPAIVYAAQQGNVDIVRLLFEPGATHGALGQAAGHAWEETVRALLEMGEPVDSPWSEGEGTALHAAASCQVTWHVADHEQVTSRQKREYFAVRQTSLLRVLLEAGANVEARDAAGRTPLMRLAMSQCMLTVKGRHMANTGTSDIVPALRLLLEAGADARTVDHDEMTALHYLAQAEPWATHGYRASTAVKLLLAAGADPNARTAEGWTPLYLNASRARPGIMRSLVAAGATVDIADPQGKTPLLLAIEHRQTQAVKFLLAHGADPNRLDREGLSPLDQAQLDQDKSVIAIVKRAGGVAHAGLERQLHRAIEHGHDDAVKDLLARGADPNRWLGWANSLLVAVSYRRYQFLPLLVAAGGDVNRTRPKTSPLLVEASRAGDLDLVRTLLDLGADLAARDPKGFSPALLAAWGRHWELHTLLVERGAPPEPRAQPFLAIRDFPAAAATAAFDSARATLDKALGVAGEPFAPLPGVVTYTLNVDPNAESERLRRGESKMWAGDNALAEHVGRVLLAVRPLLREAGYLAVDLGRGIGCGPARQFVGLFPTADPYVVVAAVGTFGNDDERPTPEILEWMRETYEDEPWELLGCGRATLDLQFLGPVQQPLRLADRMMALCSDVGHNGREKLAAQLVATRQARFWWD